MALSSNFYSDQLYYIVKYKTAHPFDGIGRLSVQPLTDVRRCVQADELDSRSRSNQH